MKAKILSQLFIVIFVLFCFSCSELPFRLGTQSKTSAERGSIGQTNDAEQEGSNSQKSNSPKSDGTGNEPQLSGKLIRAIKAGNVDLVKNLLEQGASPNAKESGKYALDYALSLYDDCNDRYVKRRRNCPDGIKAVSTKKSIVELLVKAGADVRKGDFLHKAVQGTDENGLGRRIKTAREIELQREIVKLLIDSGADVNKPDESKETPLFFTNDPETVRLLLEHGANPNAKSKSGDTPLVPLLFRLGRFVYPDELAKRFLDSIRLLVEAGADVNAVSGAETLMCIAKRIEDDSAREQVIRLFRSKGAECNFDY